MQRSLAFFIASAAMLAGLWLAAAPTAIAQVEQEATTVTMLEPEPGPEPGTVVLTARLNIEESGYPLGSRPVQFVVQTSFFANRPLILETRTDGSGVATAVYAVAWEGEHNILARFPGDADYLPSEASSITLDSAETGVRTGGVHTGGEGPQSLAPLDSWALGSVGVAWIVLLAIFAFVMVRVVWTIRREERISRQPATPSSPHSVATVDGER